MSYDILNYGISIDRLQTFCRVVEAGSITAAAEGHPNRQSLYSRQIRQLEEAMGKRLFIRKGKSLLLSEDGRRLAVMTNAYFSALNEFALGEAASMIRIGTGESVLEAFIYPRFKALRDALPGVRFEFVSLATQGIVKELVAGGIELGLLREDVELEGCEARFVGALEFDLMIPRVFLPKGGIAEINRVKELPMAILSGKGSFVRTLLSLIQKERLSLIPVVMADSFTKLAALAQASDLAVVLPRELSTPFSKDQFVRYCPTSFGQLTRRLALAISSDAKIIRPTLDRYFELISQILISD